MLGIVRQISVLYGTCNTHEPLTHLLADGTLITKDQSR